jgi:aldose sugar dehydrogenase
VQPRASLRFGGDGKMYLAFDDAGDEQGSGSWSSYSGKLLRLNADGTTPADQASPVIGRGVRSPRGLDWAPATGLLWLGDAKADGSEQLAAPLIAPLTAPLTTASTRYLLPRLTGTAGLAFYRGALIPGFQNTLLVAASDARQILRLRFNAADPRTIDGIERLLDTDDIGPVRVVSVNARGEIYFCTDTALGRIGPS